MFLLLLAILGITEAPADVTRQEGLTLAVQPAVRPRVQPFRLTEVRLLDGPFKEAQDIGVRYLLSLEPDRFLARFRTEAGLTAKAEHYGGWELQGVSGHSAGHYLSACAIAWASTGDARFAERVKYMVEELATCQRANTNGYLAAIPNGRRVFAEVSAGNIRSAGFDLNGCWVPNYTLHKLMAGLRDAYRLCGSTNALQVERLLADWLESVYGHLTDDQMQKVMACEHGGLNETFADLYADTADTRYLALSRKFHHKAILEPLARGEDILPGKHANTQIPKLIGLATRYELASDPADRAAAVFFWDRVVRHHSYVTGGHCNHEYFGPPDQLSDRLSPETTETCNVYNMLKLSRHLFGWEANPAVADFYERALLNHIRATQHPDGRVIYNLSLQPGHHKEYQALQDGFTCCMGSGMENHVKYGEGIYFHDSTNLWVNLFIASELRWASRRVTLRQETAFPDDETVKFTVHARRSARWTLNLRHPAWATDPVTVRVNGKPWPANSKPSSYIPIHRAWRDGDTIVLHLPMSLRTESMPDNPHRVALFHGPTLLAANLGPEDDPHAADPMYVPVLVTDAKPPAQWLQRIGTRGSRFRSIGVGRDHDLDFEPLWSLHDRRYSVYLDEYTEPQWQARAEVVRAERERQKELEARSIDSVRPGEMQPERDHAFAGDKAEVIESLGRKGRETADNGWFSFRLKVTPDTEQELLVTYREGDRRRRIFDVLVDGQTVGTRELARDGAERLVEETYRIPSQLTAGKESVTVRFQSRTNTWTGPVLGVRVLRSKAP